MGNPEELQSRVKKLEDDFSQFGNLQKDLVRKCLVFCHCVQHCNTNAVNQYNRMWGYSTNTGLQYNANIISFTRDWLPYCILKFLTKYSAWFCLNLPSCILRAIGIKPLVKILPNKSRTVMYEKGFSSLIF